MSLFLSSTPTIRAFSELAGRVTKSASGAPRDRGPDPRVRRNCVDENAPAAQPWDRNRFGSTADRIATVESLVAVAKELQAEHAAAFPRGRLLKLETAHAMLAAELDDLKRRPPGERPIGRPAAIMIELEAIEAELGAHAMGITRTDIDVYEAMFEFLCFAGSGRWFPSWSKIAAKARCCERSVGRALRRLDHHGLLAWISRSTMSQKRGDRSKPTRVQTTHAYFLDLRKKMAERVYQRFLQLRDRRRKRFGIRTAPGAPDQPPPKRPTKDVADLRRSIADLGAAVFHPDGHLGRV